MNLIQLKTFLESIIKEEIVSLKEKIKFNPQELTHFPSLEEKEDFLNKVIRLQFLGAGSSRRVYRLDSKRVIKLAKGRSGIAQNQVEIEASQELGFIVAKVFDYDKKEMSWVISELVRPLKSKEEFYELTGIIFDDFEGFIYEIASGRTPESIIKSFKLMANEQKPKFGESWYKKGIDSILNVEKSHFPKGILIAVKEKGMRTPDLVQIYHWGKTPDQRVVLLDYGFTKEIENKYY